MGIPLKKSGLDIRLVGFVVLGGGSVVFGGVGFVLAKMGWGSGYPKKCLVAG